MFVIKIRLTFFKEIFSKFSQNFFLIFRQKNNEKSLVLAVITKTYFYGQLRSHHDRDFHSILYEHKNRTEKYIKGEKSFTI